MLTVKEGAIMKWNPNKSILLSQVCVVLFAVLLALTDLFCYWLVGAFLRVRGITGAMGFWMMGTIYLCSVFAWLLLWKLWKLLRNLRAGQTLW